MKNNEIQLTLEEVMPLLSRQLQDKLDFSVQTLRKGEKTALLYSKDGYWLGFSGGKDSQALYHAAKLASVRFKAFFSPTTVDPGEVLRFIHTHYPDVTFIHPKISIYEEAVKRRMLPTMTVRWCCAVYKESLGAGHVTLTGIRRAESTKRANRMEFEFSKNAFRGNDEEFEKFREQRIEKIKKSKKKSEEHLIVTAEGVTTVGCISGKETIIVNPIVYWTDKDVWEFLDAIGAEHCKLYNEGRKRIGCILCPYSSRKNKLGDIEKFPYVKAKWIDAIKRIRIIYKDKGIQNENSVFYDAIGGNVRCAGLPEEEGDEKIAQDVFDWWISGKSAKKWAHDRFAQGDIFTDME